MLSRMQNRLMSLTWKQDSDEDGNLSAVMVLSLTILPFLSPISIDTEVKYSKRRNRLEVTMCFASMISSGCRASRSA